MTGRPGVVTPVESLPLFPGSATAGAATLALGADARRTLRQAALLADGLNPATRLPLHPQAAPPGDRQAEGLRCGGCAKLWRKNARGFEGFKCGAVGTPRTDGPDARKWWSACILYREGDPR